MVLEKMKTSSKKAFTLIELLVVITIIGILATGATATYTSQIQKSRDSTRLTSIEALRGGIEQVYQDVSEYPAVGSGFSAVAAYTPKIPVDPKTGQKNANTSFDYAYVSGVDTNGVDLQEFELSTGFENNGTTTGKAKVDGGDDDFRYEIGIDIKNNISKIKDEQTTVVKWTGNPTSITGDICVTIDSNDNVACTRNTVTSGISNGTVMIIR